MTTIILYAALLIVFQAVLCRVRIRTWEGWALSLLSAVGLCALYETLMTLDVQGTTVPIRIDIVILVPFLLCLCVFFLIECVGLAVHKLKPNLTEQFLTGFRRLSKGLIFLAADVLLLAWLAVMILSAPC